MDKFATRTAEIHWVSDLKFINKTLKNRDGLNELILKIGTFLSQIVAFLSICVKNTTLESALFQIAFPHDKFQLKPSPVGKLSATTQAVSVCKLSRFKFL